MPRRSSRPIACALGVLCSIHCGPSAQDRSAEDPSSHGVAQPSATPPRECAPFIEHFRPIFLEATAGHSFGTPAGNYPLVVPSIDGPRIERLHEAFGRPAPPSPPTNPDLGRELSSVGRAYVENMRALLRAVAEADLTSYRALTGPNERIHKDFEVLDNELLTACSDSLLKLTGRLPPQVIQAIVRESYDQLRKCYELGLARNPEMIGRVSVRFVIDRDGSVKNATAAQTVSVGPVGPRPDPGTEPFFEKLGLRVSHAMDSTPLQDQAVIDCVVTQFQKLRFPPPKGGIVTVVYPIQFEPG